MPAWEQLYKSKIMEASQAIRKIKPGDRIFIGTGCGQPQALVDELASDRNDIMDAEIYHLLAAGDAPYVREEFAKKFRTYSFFLSDRVREAVAEGRADYIPMFISEIPSLFKTGKLPIDVCLIQTAPPDRNGNLNLGVSVDIVKAAVENCLTIIAEVNEKMPRTFGDSFIPLEKVDAVVLSSREILESALPAVSAVEEAIARNVASLIEDGFDARGGHRHDSAGGAALPRREARSRHPYRDVQRRHHPAHRVRGNKREPQDHQPGQDHLLLLHGNAQALRLHS